MRDEKFKVIQYIRELLAAIDKEMDNFPKKDIELKNRIRVNSFDLLEIAYEANSISDVEKKKCLLQKSFAKIKVIDFLFLPKNIKLLVFLYILVLEFNSNFSFLRKLVIFKRQYFKYSFGLIF